MFRGSCFLWRKRPSMPTVRPSSSMPACLGRPKNSISASGRGLPSPRAINQAVAISGATTQEASAGLIQFCSGVGHPVGSKAKRLRAVLEQIPRLARSIADGLGVTVGELRRLGSEGLLTPQAIIRAHCRRYRQP